MFSSTEVVNYVAFLYVFWGERGDSAFFAISYCTLLK